MARRAIGRRGAAAAATALLALALAACGVARSESSSSKPPSVISVSPAHGRVGGSAAERVPRSHCPVGLRRCRSVRGEIVYVEAHDPDGDGDVHFVIVDSQGITLPGLTAVKVETGMHPHPLPGVGDVISAAGPVQSGSLGESEIRALEVRVAAHGAR